jgi:hypothetical protein
MLVGAAANQCLQTGQPVKIADRVTGLRKPDNPAMPTHSDPVPMPGYALFTAKAQRLKEILRAFASSRLLG